MLGSVSPELPVLHLPAWDCLPYDRVSPGADASARRLAALNALAALKKSPHPAIVLTTANAILQRLPPQAALAEQVISARPGNQLDMNDLAARLERNRREIARLRTEAGLRRCAAFASPGCTRIAMTTARLDRENAILEGRLRELIAVVNGRPSPALYVRACTASWQPVVKSHPVFRRKAMPRRKFLKAKKPISEQKAKIITPNPPKPAAITLTPLLPVQPAASTPSVQPVTVKATPPPERPYDANLHIRVVGPLFYPALSAAGDRPVPVHAPAP